MANINDYLAWRGDIPIGSKFQFNEVDSMILARFSYLLFDRISMKREETIKTISEKMHHFSDGDFLYHGDKELTENLGASSRFNKMLVSDYIKTNDEKNEEQFSAITIHLSSQELYISYIGTDNTINGWKEDVNMGFLDNVPCQLAGKKYLEMIAKKYPYKKIRIGGHSKGGNIAIYSALVTNPEIQERILKVDNFDGPGLNRNTINKYGKNSMVSKIESFIPQDSVIGRILEHVEKVTISYSVEKGLMQHDIYSWQVLKDSMIKSEKNTEMSEDICQTFREWIDDSTPEQRRILFDSIFELLYSTDAKRLKEIKETMAISIPKILEKYREISNEDKKTISDMIKLFVNSYIIISRKKETNKIKKFGLMKRTN